MPVGVSPAATPRATFVVEPRYLGGRPCPPPPGARASRQSAVRAVTDESSADVGAQAPRRQTRRRPATGVAAPTQSSGGHVNSLLHFLQGLTVARPGAQSRGQQKISEVSDVQAVGTTAHAALGTCAVPVDLSAAVPNNGKKAVRIFDQDILLYRNDFGELSALNDECPHAGASLSQGSIIGSRIRCCYHGFEYDRSGACISARSGAAQTYDVSEVNGVIFVGLRGLGEAGQVTRGSHVPFVTELAEEGFSPGLVVAQKDPILKHFGAVYENIISAEHLVGVHKMVPSRNKDTSDSSTIVFEQPLKAMARHLCGGDHLTCTIRMRPPFASFVEQRTPNGIRGQIFMFVVPTNGRDASELITIYRQNFLTERQLPGLTLQHLVRDHLIAPQVERAIAEDRFVIEAQKYRQGEEQRAHHIASMSRTHALERAQKAAGKPRVVVFGASGGTGRYLIDELLDDGHEVTAFVRSADRLDIKHNRLRIVCGDILDPAAVAAVVPGHDAAMVAIGPGPGGPVDVCSRGTRHVVEAMHQAGIKRLVAVTSYGIGNTQAFLSGPESLFYRVVMGPMLADKAAQEQVISDSSLNWTLLRPRQLVDAPIAGLCAKEDGSSVGASVSRRAVARFARQILGESEATHRSYALSQ